MEFINIIEIEMKKKNLTAYKLCKDLEISQTTFSSWRKGKIPKVDTAIKIIRYLEVSADEILGIEKNNKLTDNERELLDQYRKLDYRTQIKVIGMIEQIEKDNKSKLSTSKNGEKERENKNAV